jgi:glycosyltransferase involved in cell wall biosynthesis
MYLSILFLFVTFSCDLLCKERVENGPIVTIITSLYNGDEFIEQFMIDVIRQTIFNQCEWIIINANSPGNEEAVIKRYCAFFPNITYIRLQEDPGLYAVWNMAIQMSSAPFITNANVDDRLGVSAFQSHAQALLENPNVDIVYTDLWYTYEPNRLFEYDHTKVRMSLPPSSIVSSCIGNHPMWRRTMHDRIGLFDERYKSAGDWEMWLRAYDNGTVFMRIGQGHGLFYINPHGLSTGRAAEGANQESAAIRKQYEYLFAPYAKSTVWDNKCCKAYSQEGTE